MTDAISNPDILPKLDAALQLVFEQTAEECSKEVRRIIGVQIGELPDDNGLFQNSHGLVILAGDLDEPIDEWLKGTTKIIKGELESSSAKDRVRATVYNFFHWNETDSPPNAQRLIEWLGLVGGPYPIPVGWNYICLLDERWLNVTLSRLLHEQWSEERLRRVIARLNRVWPNKTISKFWRRFDLMFTASGAEVVNPLTASLGLGPFAVPPLKGKARGDQLKANRRAVLRRVVNELCRLNRKCHGEKLTRQLIGQYPELLLCKHWEMVRHCGLEGRNLPIELTKGETGHVVTTVLNSLGDRYKVESLIRISRASDWQPSGSE
jgi:hypothetical protein